jgi:hypothetical protein
LKCARIQGREKKGAELKLSWCRTALRTEHPGELENAASAMDPAAAKNHTFSRLKRRPTARGFSL